VRFTSRTDDFGNREIITREDSLGGNGRIPALMGEEADVDDVLDMLANVGPNLPTPLFLYGNDDPIDAEGSVRRVIGQVDSFRAEDNIVIDGATFLLQGQNRFRMITIDDGMDLIDDNMWGTYSGAVEGRDNRGALGMGEWDWRPSYNGNGELFAVMYIRNDGSGQVLSMTLIHFEELYVVSVVSMVASGSGAASVLTITFDKAVSPALVAADITMTASDDLIGTGFDNVLAGTATVPTRTFTVSTTGDGYIDVVVARAGTLFLGGVQTVGGFAQ